MTLHRSSAGERVAACAADESGRTVLETVIVLLLLLVLLFVVIDRFMASVVPIKETALRVELSNLRSAVSYYAMRNRRLPPSILALLEENVVVSSPAVEGAEYRVVVLGKYVESMTTDGRGRPLDPFGNPYSYDPSTGGVKSTTRGYEMW